MKQAEFQKKMLEILERIDQRLRNIENYLKSESEEDYDYEIYEQIKSKEEKNIKKNNSYQEGDFQIYNNRNN